MITFTYLLVMSTVETWHRESFNAIIPGNFTMDQKVKISRSYLRIGTISGTSSQWQFATASTL